MEQGALPGQKDRQSRHPFQRLYGCGGLPGRRPSGAGPWRKERPTAVPVLLGGKGSPAAAFAVPLCGGRTIILAGALSSQRLTKRMMCHDCNRPSILSADFANLGRDVQRVREADWLQCGCDGRACLSPTSTLACLWSNLCEFTDQFWMYTLIEKPVHYVDAFADAGADLLTVHLEADMPPRHSGGLAAMGGRASEGRSPATAHHAAAEAAAWDKVDLILVMTVEQVRRPGVYGPISCQIAAIRRYIQERNPACRLEVDGGVDP